MASNQEFKARIRSVNETQKITSAMYLISSNEMKRARKKLEAAMPFFENLEVEIKRIFRTQKLINSPFFYPLHMDEFVNGTYGILLITADKGFAGQYNEAIIKESIRLIDEHPDVKLYVVGGVGKRFFKDAGYSVEDDFNFSSDNPRLSTANEISTLMIEDYLEGKIKKIFVQYTRVSGSMQEKVVSTRLLPFHHAFFTAEKELIERKVTQDFEFYPDPESVLNNIIKTYMQGFVYGAMVESYCAEHISRMLSMSEANDNAVALQEKLKLEFQHMRQAQITSEIIEVTAGAKALKHKHEEGKGIANESRK